MFQDNSSSNFLKLKLQTKCRIVTEKIVEANELEYQWNNATVTFIL